MAGLSKKQKEAMNKHRKHHTSRHMRRMTSLMEKGDTFSVAHKKTMKEIGR
jgi:hypothetical protein